MPAKLRRGGSMKPSLVDTISAAILRKMSAGASPLGAGVAASGRTALRRGGPGRRRGSKPHPGALLEDQVVMELLASALAARLSGPAQSRQELPLEAVEI